MVKKGDRWSMPAMRRMEVTAMRAPCTLFARFDTKLRCGAAFVKIIIFVNVITIRTT